MTMATINLLLGMLLPFLALGLGLGALAYAADGMRRSGILRRWNLFVAVLLAAMAYGLSAGIGKDFARASDRVLIGTPADPPSVIAVVILAVVSCAVFVAGVTHVRGLFRSST